MLCQANKMNVFMNIIKEFHWQLQKGCMIEEQVKKYEDSWRPLSLISPPWPNIQIANYLKDSWHFIWKSWPVFWVFYSVYRYLEAIQIIKA